MSEGIDVSVVIISKNEIMLNGTMQAIFREIVLSNNDGISAECVVVDSSEGALDWISAKFPEANWISFKPLQRKRITIPEQRNIGIRNSRGRVIVFCDAGGIPVSGWLTALSAPILRGFASATCGPVHSKNLDHYGVMNNVEDGAIVDSTATCNLALSKNLVIKVGDFDEKFNYGSDTDYCWRIADAGLKIVNAANAELEMDWGRGSIQFRRAWRYGQARGRLFSKYPSRRWQMVVTSFEYVAYAVWAAGLLFAGAWLVAQPHSASLAAFTVVVSALLLPLFRNRKHKDFLHIVAIHIVGGVSFAIEFLKNNQGFTSLRKRKRGVSW